MRRCQSGQAAVESAIVLPLMVFFMLGIIQFNLMYQARMVAKVAAYQAVRAGAMYNADRGKMERAALATLLPTTAMPTGNGVAKVRSTPNLGKWLAAYAEAKAAQAAGGAAGLPVVKVGICNPVKNPGGRGAFDVKLGASEVDFDDNYASSLKDLKDAGDDALKEMRRGKLGIQIVHNYVMPIPFANQVIHRIWLGQQIVTTLRLGTGDDTSRAAGMGGSDPLVNMGAIRGAAMAGTYIIPIRAEYNMRMQSNIYTSKLPAQQTDECLTYLNNQ